MLGGLARKERKRDDGRREREREVERRRTLRLEKLNDRPNGDVLEGLIGGSEESNEVEVETSFGLGPDGVEGGVVVGG